jgi:hypothetical protein
MKRYTNKNLLSNSQNQTYLTDNLLRIIESLYTSKINNKYDYLDRLVKIYSIPSENITVQSLLLGINPKFSTKKENYYSAYKPQLSSKIEIQQLKDKASVNFLNEMVIANRYGNTSEYIQKIILNSENNNVISSTRSGCNLYTDLTVSYNINNQSISLLKDIKSGNNLIRVNGGIIGEIPYIKSGELYSIINSPKTLIELNEMRFNIINNASYDKLDREQLNPYLENMKLLDPIGDKCHLKYNLMMQEELYKALSIPGFRRFNMSYYYGILVNEYQNNSDFFIRIQPYVNDSIFENKQNMTKFLTRAIIIYHNSVKPILNNIENTKGTEWAPSFIDDINNDIFS